MTTAQRPFRFGVRAANARSRDEWVAKAYRAEALGYATLVVLDHLGEQLAPLTALAAAAEATLTLRLGTFVLDNDFRHPVVLAKEAATLDLLSGGRFELGLGAGWERAEYERAGIPFDPPGVRVGRLAEAVRVLKGLFAEGPLTFAGRHYAIAGLDGQPKPLQRPHPPLLIGGGGRRILSLAAREADIVSFVPRALPDGTTDWADGTAASVAEKVAWVREAAGDLLSGAQDQAPEINVYVRGVAITADRHGAAERLARQVGVGVDDVLDSPFALAGTVEQIAEELRARRERYGISYVVVRDQVMEAFAPVVARLAGT
jgi:probable F420-dependent oxidoreductase